MSTHLSLQQRYAAKSICFGCGPANQHGLQIESFVDTDRLIAQFTPKLEHQAFPGVLCGGIVGTLMDCHCNWMASYALMQAQKLDAPPSTVTADYQIKLKHPTPIGDTLSLEAWVVEVDGNRATTAGHISANGVITASCEGRFVAVNEGHPAYHRW